MQKNHPQRNQSKKQPVNNQTSWGEVASWYDEYLQDEDTYQAQVIAPNLIRLLSVTELDVGAHILELGCGQGFFLDIVLHEGKGKKILLEGIDVSSELLNIAAKKFGNEVTLTHTEAAKLSHIKDKSIDMMFAVLALQNMSNLDAVIAEVARTLNYNGRFVAVINHPAFRVPKQSDWHVSKDRNAQGRVVYTYMSDKKFAIDMHPGLRAAGKKTEETFSFHHPLQYYAKIFAKYGLCISRIEEWISHKVSEDGPKKRMEDESRKEIPMFMCFEIKHLPSGKSL